MSEPVEDYTQALLSIRRRDDNLGGIPSFLALGELTRPQDGPAAAGEAPDGPLARLAVAYLERQLGDRSEATLDDLHAALSVLAAHHFDLPGGAGPPA